MKSIMMNWQRTTLKRMVNTSLWPEILSHRRTWATLISTRIHLTPPSRRQEMITRSFLAPFTNVVLTVKWWCSKRICPAIFVISTAWTGRDQLVQFALNHTRLQTGWRITLEEVTATQRRLPMTSWPSLANLTWKWRVQPLHPSRLLSLQQLNLLNNCWNLPDWFTTNNEKQQCNELSCQMNHIHSNQKLQPFQLLNILPWFSS